MAWYDGKYGVSLGGGKTGISIQPGAGSGVSTSTPDGKPLPAADGSGPPMGGNYEGQRWTGLGGQIMVFTGGAWQVAPSSAPPFLRAIPDVVKMANAAADGHSATDFSYVPGAAPKPQPGYVPAPNTPGAAASLPNRPVYPNAPTTPPHDFTPQIAPGAPGGVDQMIQKYYNPPAPPPTATTPSNMGPDMQGMIDKYAAGRGTPAIAPTTVGPAGVATASTSVAPTVATTTLDRTQDNQTREQQQQSISDLFNASRGLTPSAAELQSRQTLDRNVANQYAIAAALQGRSAGGALKQASDATGALNAQGAADAAVLRAKEQDAARAALSSMLLGVRNTDVTAENAQGQLTSASNLKQADVTSATGIANAGNETQASATNANNQTSIVKTQADIDADRAKNDVVNTLKSRGLDDEQIGRFLTAMTTGRGQDITAATAARGQDITARGQDLQAQADAARNATARELGIGQLELTRSLQEWAKTKDITTLVGSLLAAGASNGAVQKFIGGLTGDGSSPGYTGNYGSTVNGVPIDSAGGGYDDSRGTGDLGADDYGNDGIADGGT